MGQTRQGREGLRAGRSTADPGAAARGHGGGGAPATPAMIATRTTLGVGGGGAGGDTGRPSGRRQWSAGPPGAYSLSPLLASVYSTGKKDQMSFE